MANFFKGLVLITTIVVSGAALAHYQWQWLDDNQPTWIK